MKRRIIWKLFFVIGSWVVVAGCDRGRPVPLSPPPPAPKTEAVSTASGPGLINGR